jgi:pheromone shutdown protein TraB
MPSPRADAAAPPLWARHTATLPHPDGGGACYVLGTAHISASSATEAGDLIRTLRPDAVVVELDAERFAALQRAQRARGNSGGGVDGDASASASASSASSASSVASRGDSAAKLASLLARGDGVPFAGAMGYALAGALLGAVPGGEFDAAVDAANDVGATLILGDRDFRITLARLKARLAAAAADARAESRHAGGKGSGARDVDDALSRGPLPLMRAAGCVSPEAALAAAKRLLRDATAAEASVRASGVSVADLREVRACASAVVEHARERELRAAAADAAAAGGTPPGVALERAREGVADDVAALRDSGESSIARGLPPSAAAAVQRTLVAERDLILARAMQLPLSGGAGGGGGGRVVVGVVGAGHVPGICREWRGARSPEAYARAQDALTARPSELPPPGAGATLAKAALAAGGGALALARPRGALKLAAFVGCVGALGCAGGAAAVRAAARALDALQRADVALRQEDAERALSGHAGGAQ